MEAVIVTAGVIVTAIGVAALMAWMPVARRTPTAGRVPTASRPSQLIRLERIVERSGEDALAAHTQLRPLVVEIVEGRLARRGLRLDGDAEQLRHLLGPDTWELVRPDRPQPPDRAPGLGSDRLEAVLDRLETL